MTRLESRPIADTRVYAQDTKPSDRRDGILWVDTSDPSRPVAVFSEDSGQFEPVKTDVPLFVTQEAVSFTEADVTTAGDSISLQSGTWQLSRNWYSCGTMSSSAYSSDGDEVGLQFTPKRDFSGGVQVELGSYRLSEGSYTARLYEGDTTGTVLWSNQATYGPGDQITMPEPLTGGTSYTVTIESHHSGDFGRDSVSLPVETNDYTIDRHWDKDTWRTSQQRGIKRLTPLAGTQGSVRVMFDSIPDDLTTWDIATWQQYQNDGTVTVDVETDDGTGWTTLNADVLPPVDISDVPVDHDVRVNISVSRPSEADASPQIPYVARRGER